VDRDYHLKCVAKISYSDFKKKVLFRIWPNSDPEVPGPENLQNSLEAFVQSGLASVHMYNRCLQDQNFNVFPQCSTYYRCGLSVLPNRPDGVVRRLWTVAGKICSPFTYIQRTADEVRGWAAVLQEVMTGTKLHTEPFPPSNKPPLPFGFQYPSPETDSKYGRALSGVWAFDESRILVAPWVQSDESIVIEWTGSKSFWGPDDLLPNDPTFEDAVTFYVQMSYERDFGCNMERFAMYKAEHEAMNADLLYDCREKTQVRETSRTVAEGQAAWEAYLAGETEPPPAPAVSDAPVVVAFIADYGVNNNDPKPTGPMQVAAMVKAMDPVAIVTGGDNNYPSGGGMPGIDVNIGALYRNFMHPYNGTQALWPDEVDATVNRFWPCLGNHDLDGIDEASGTAPYFDYFKGMLPEAVSTTAPGVPRYYEVTLGPMHFFILNSGYDTAKAIHEPHGIGGASLQATWLQERVALSAAPFKIAVLHHSPYSSISDHGPGEPALRWQFKQMGLDLVLSGHSHGYERFNMDNFPCVVCGAAGAPLQPMGDPLPGSAIRIAGVHGALILTADCSVLNVEFVDTTGTTLDSISILA
jgi:hypothetical protein